MNYYETGKSNPLGAQEKNFKHKLHDLLRRLGGVNIGTSEVETYKQ